MIRKREMKKKRLNVSESKHRMKYERITFNSALDNW